MASWRQHVSAKRARGGDSRLKDTTARLLDKSEQSVAAADHLLRDGYADFAAARAYYAMFYAAEALLSEAGHRFRKHAGIHAAFGTHFAKTGLLDPKYHSWLLDAFDKRIIGDYGIEQVLARGDAALLISQATEFVGAARAFLNNPPTEPQGSPPVTR